MAQYWLQTPIENAKEVIQRFVDDNIAALPGLAGKKVSYTELTEVIFYENLFPNDPYLSDDIYFGTFYITHDGETNVQVGIQDASLNSIITFDASYTIYSGQYPHIIWNFANGFPDHSGYFVGYKFKLK